MAITSNNKKGQDDKKYKVINLKYEYEGYEGNEKWAIIGAFSLKLSACITKTGLRPL